MNANEFKRVHDIKTNHYSYSFFSFFIHTYLSLLVTLWIVPSIHIIFSLQMEDSSVNADFIFVEDWSPISLLVSRSEMDER